MPEHRINARFAPSSRSLSGIFVGSVLLLSLCGCRSLCKQPVAEHVVEARTISSRGLEAMQKGDYEQAERCFAQAIKTCPVDERARCRYAELLWRRGQHAAATREMEEAVRLSAGDANLLVQLGEMHLAQRNIPRAQSEAERAIKADFHNAAAWALHGDAMQAAGNYGEALASYHRALAVQEHYPHVQLAIADVYRAQRKPQRALATLTALEDRYGPGQAPAIVLVNQGLALKELGRYDDAVETLTLAVQRGSTLADTYCELADAQLQTGDSVNARLSIAAALEQSPQHERSLRLREVIGAQTVPLTARN